MDRGRTTSSYTAAFLVVRTSPARIKCVVLPDPCSCSYILLAKTQDLRLMGIANNAKDAVYATQHTVSKYLCRLC